MNKSSCLSFPFFNFLSSLEMKMVNQRLIVLTLR